MRLLDAERRQTLSHIAQQFNEYATEPEEDDWPKHRVSLDSKDGFDAARYHWRHDDSIDFGVRSRHLRELNQGVVGLPRRSFIRDIEKHAPDFRSVRNVGRGEFHRDRKADFGCPNPGLTCRRSQTFVNHGNTGPSKDMHCLDFVRHLSRKIDWYRER